MKYKKCTTIDGDNKPWCSTNTDIDGVHVGGGPLVDHDGRWIFGGGHYQYCDECSGVDSIAVSWSSWSHSVQTPEAHCRNVKVRRNVKSLSSAEKERLVNALNRLVHNGRYKEMGNIHGAPATICDGFCCPHGPITLLPWHRLYMAQMEEELGEPLPYWNWTEDPEIPDLWEGIRAPLKEGIEKHERWCEAGPFIERDQNIRIDTEDLKEKTRLALKTETFKDFHTQISQPHDALHKAAGCDMVTTGTSGYDPTFYLHHAYIDHLWAFWQELQKLRRINEPPLEEFDHENPPFNRAEERHGFKNNNQRTLQNNRGRDTLEYKKNFCYEYDQLLFEGKTPAEFIDQHAEIDRILKSPNALFRSNILPPKGKCKKVCDKSKGKTFCEEVCRVGKTKGFFVKVFVGVVMPRIAPSGVSAFDLCQGGKCVKGGEVSTFGSTTERVENHKSKIDDKNFHLIETDVTKIVDKQRWTLKKPLVAKMTSTMVGNLPQPVVIRKTMGKGGKMINGTVTFNPKEKRRHYGNLLQKYSG